MKNNRWKKKRFQFNSLFSVPDSQAPTPVCHSFLLQSGDNSESTTWIHDPGSLCVNSSDRCCVINAGTLKPINHCLNNTVQQSSAAAWLYGHIYHLPAVITSMMFHVTKQKSSSHGLWTRLRVRPRKTTTPPNTFERHRPRLSQVTWTSTESELMIRWTWRISVF